ncbi:hypothetical protein [Maribacter sp. 2210JD10-5]|uniref:hypothetical protein n=1 Tax=Maribacter sp. 2210JD10-5 TaxID=3386272 RepID=UPI0039BC7251
MKNYVLSVALTVIGCLYSSAQVPANYNADNESFGMQPMLQYAFQQLNSKTIRGLEETDIIGSRYLSEEFKKTAIYSGDGNLEGYAFSRYDGYNDEIQLKKNLSDDDISVLLRRADIYCMVGNTAIVFKKYYDKSGKLQRGHLFKLRETDNLILYERKIKNFKEGKRAANSLQMNVKSRFVGDSELYFMKKGDDKIQYLKTTKKGVIGLFKEDTDKVAAIKQHISDKNIKIKESDDIVRIINYYETL